MGVKGVDHVVERSVLGGLLGQIGRRTAAEDEHVDVLVAGLEVCNGADGHALGRDLDVCRVAARVDGNELRVVVLSNGQLNALPEVAVAQNTNTSHMRRLSVELKATVGG